MKLSVKGIAISSALIWGLAILLVGMGSMIWPPYGNEFLEVVSSIYPGYQAGTGAGSVIIGTLYGVVDAGIGGAVFAWLYNCFA
jgi:hypothetical protein